MFYRDTYVYDEKIKKINKRKMRQQNGLRYLESLTNRKGLHVLKCQS